MEHPQSPQNQIEGQPSSSDSTVLSKPSKQFKKKIMCKFFIMGHCNKGENCIYLHSEEERNKRMNAPVIECPMYSLGYCKNGPLCKYKHTKIQSKEDIENEILPIWYIEHYFDKPISMIFQDLEKENAKEVQEIKNKYGIVDKPKIYINNGDIYAEKKNSIEYMINNKRSNVSYFLLKCDKFSDVKKSMESNTFILREDILCKISLKNSNKNDICIGIIYDEENENYMGFLKFKHIIDRSTMKVEWLWRTKLHYSKLSHLINKKDNDNYFIDAYNGCMIDNELGNYLCRMMMKRLNKEEVREFIQEKKNFEYEQVSKHYRDYKRTQNIYVTKINNVHVNINHHNYNYNNNYYVSHKRERDYSDRRYNKYNRNYKHN